MGIIFEVLRIWQQLCISSTMALWHSPLFEFVLAQSHKGVNEMAGKFKLTFFQYWPMNFIFIYFSKRQGGSYWRGALVRRNMVGWWMGIWVGELAGRQNTHGCCMHACIYVCIRMYCYACMYLGMYKYVFWCMYVSICMHVHVYMYVLAMYKS